MLNVKILGSSSKGNCYLLNTAQETLILEAGVPLHEIKKGLDFNLRRVSGCLVSHEHGDHAKSVSKLMGAGVDVYTSKGTFDALGIDVKHHRAKVLTPLNTLNVGGFRVLPFDIKHDAQEPLGFMIENESFGRLMFATDTKHLKYKFRDLDYLMIEANYSEKILEERGDESPSHIERVKNSHLSIEGVVRMIEANDWNLKEVYLMHLSNGNSDAQEFKKIIQKVSGARVIVC